MKLTPQGRMRVLIDLRGACSEGLKCIDADDPWQAANVSDLWWFAGHLGVAAAPAEAAAWRSVRAAAWAALTVPGGQAYAEALIDARTLTHAAGIAESATEVGRFVDQAVKATRDAVRTAIKASRVAGAAGEGMSWFDADDIARATVEAATRAAVAGKTRTAVVWAAEQEQQRADLWEACMPVMRDRWPVLWDRVATLHEANEGADDQ